MMSAPARVSLRTQSAGRDIRDYERVYLHVGLHRTGTTYIQRVILPLLNIDRLVKPRASELLPRGNYDPAALRSELNALLPEKRHAALVISQETLSGRPENNPPDWPAALVERLHAAVPEGRIILVLRNQWDYLESMYAYRVMSLGLEVRSFNRYLKSNLRKSLLQTLAYDRLVSAYRSSYGEGNVLVLLQEQLESDSAEFVARLCGFLQVEMPALSESRRVNMTSRAPAVLRLHRLLNLPGRGATNTVRFLGGYRASRVVRRTYSRIKERIAAPLTLGRSQGSRERLVVDQAVRNAIDEAIGPVNRRLQTLLSEDLVAHGYHVS